MRCVIELNIGVLSLMCIVFDSYLKNKNIRPNPAPLY